MRLSSNTETEFLGKYIEASEDQRKEYLQDKIIRPHASAEEIQQRKDEFRAVIQESEAHRNLSATAAYNDAKGKKYVEISGERAAEKYHAAYDVMQEKFENHRKATTYFGTTIIP